MTDLDRERAEYLHTLARDMAEAADVTMDEALEALRRGLIGKRKPIRRFYPSRTQRIGLTIRRWLWPRSPKGGG